jgi:hypothetical protein
VEGYIVGSGTMALTTAGCDHVLLKRTWWSERLHNIPPLGTAYFHATKIVALSQ